MAICAGSGVGCIIVGLQFAVFNAAVAIGTGAGAISTVLNTAIGLGVGIATGGLVGWLTKNPLVGLIAGSVSAAVTTGISNAISTKGKYFWGWNMLGAAVLTAAQGAATYGLQQAIAVSQASANPGTEGDDQINKDLAEGKRLKDQGEIGRAASSYIKAVREAIAANAADSDLGPAVSYDGRIEIEIDFRNNEQRLLNGGIDAADTTPFQGGYTIKVPIDTLDQGAAFLRSTLFHEFLHIYFIQWYGSPGGRQYFLDEVKVANIENEYAGHFGLDQDQVKMGLGAFGEAQAALTEFDQLHPRYDLGRYSMW